MDPAIHPYFKLVLTDERIRAGMGEQPIAKTSADAGSPEPQGRSRGRRVFKILGFTLLALSVAGLSSIFYLRSTRFNRTAVGFIESKLREYGLRVEVGTLAFSLKPRTASLGNLRILNDKTGELIATVGQVDITIELRSPFGIRQPREVRVEEVKLSGLDLHLTLNEQGQSNLEGLKRPVASRKSVEIDYSDLRFGLTGSRLHFRDERIDLGIDLEGVEAQAGPGLGERVGIALRAAAGSVGFEGRTAPLNGLELRGEAGTDSLQIERLELDSTIGRVEAKGQLSSWTPFSYEVDFTATGQLEEVSRVFAPRAALRGTARCQCRISGTAADFLITGDPAAPRLGIGESWLEGVGLAGVTLRRRGDQLELGAREVRAGRVRVGSLSLEDVVIGQTRGLIGVGETHLSSSRGAVTAISWPGSRLEGLLLAPLQTDFVDRRYLVRATAALADGVIAGVPIHDARAAATFDPEGLTLAALEVGIDEGQAKAAVTIPLGGERPFRITGQFNQLPTHRLFSTFNVGRIPLAGSFTGEANLEWRGGAASSLAGAITADFSGGTPGATGDTPVSGWLRTTIAAGVFTLADCELRTPASSLRASGSLAVDGQSDLRLELASDQAGELVGIVRAIDKVKPLIDQYQPHLPRQFRFRGEMRGDLAEPVLRGEVFADPFGFRGVELGRASGQLNLSGREISLAELVLTDRDGGVGRLTLVLPFAAKSTTGSLKASLDRLPLREWLRALDIREPVELADLLSGRLDGQAQLTGLPGRLNGAITLGLRDGTVVRQPVESARAAISFVDHQARLDNFNLRLPQTTVMAQGSWNLVDDSFSLDGQTSNIPLALLAEALDFKQLAIDGSAEISFKAIGSPPEAGREGEPLDWQRLSFNLLATTTGLQLNQRPAGDFRIYAGTSPTGRLRAVLNSRGATEREIVFATVELKEKELPMTVNGNLENVDLAPFIAILAPEQAGRLNGTVSGGVSIAGPLRANPAPDSSSQPTIEALRGNLTISKLELNVAGNQLQLTSPLTIGLAQATITIPVAQLAGSGVEITADGRVGLANQKPLALGLRAKLDLSRLSGLTPSLTTFGTINLEAQADGTIERPNLSGVVELRNLGVSSRELPFFLSNGNGLITLAGEQLQINSFRATANDGRFEAKGSVRLDGLEPSEWRIELKAEQAELYYRELGASLSTSLVVAGTPAGQTISGSVNATRLEYDSSLDLDNLIAGGGGVSLDFDPGAIGFFGSGVAETVGRRPSIPTRLDLRLEARDALEIRGEQLNAVGTALLTVAGPSHDPNITGRLEGESGFVRFRGQRYEITRATLDLLPGNGGVILNLVAESDFRGYRVSLGLAGEIDAIETTLRSEPALSRDEIISLITTGRTESGTLTSQDPLRSGFGAAASLLTSGLISRPTEQLLGLSRFQIDPIIRPNANPAARLTVGQQLSRNLYVSYSTNLATEQDQTALTEYTFTNRFSALATYTQGGSSTRQGLDENVVTIELRGRQRFSLGFLPGPTATPEDRRRARTTSLSGRESDLPRALVSLTPLPEVKLREKRLRELLPILGQGFSRSLARLGERRLREYLQEQGYFFAEVNFRCEPLDCSGTTPQVFYDIDPSRLFELKEIRIEGTRQVQIDDLRGELQSLTASRVGGIPFFRDLPLIGGSLRGLTSNERLKGDEETIRRRLVERGYLQARVRSRLALRPENDDLLLIFNIDEGPLSRVGEVSIEGNRTIDQALLRAAVPLANGAPYSPTLARLGAQQIRQLYASHGLLDTLANLEVAETGAKNSHVLKLVYRINESNPAVVREIEIAGTTRTSPEAITRYYDFKPGEILTPEKLRATQSALYATNAFREVNLRVDDLGGPTGSAHKVTVNLSEARPLLLVYGLGYSSDDGIRGSVEVANTNLRGSLNSLSLRLRASSREQISQLSYGDLRPFGLKVPTTINLFYNRAANLRTFVRRRLLDQNGQRSDSTEGQGFGLDRYGAFIQSEKRLGQRTSLRFRYNFERASLFGIDDNLIQGTDVTRNERAIRLGMLSVGVSRDTRDNVLNPSRGQLISADHSLAAVPLGGNESFNKFFTTYQRYQTIEAATPLLGRLLDRTTFAFSARLGLAGVFRNADRNKDGEISESERRLPISERFFSGGATTLRGFRFETAGPQEILEPRPGRSCALPARPCDLPTLVPVGGDALAILNFELRYPLTQRLRFVPFYDVGNVFRRVSDFSFRRVTNTVGLGLRINTPIGPVGVDYGLLLDPPSYQSAAGALIRQPRGVFHIRLGQSF